MKAKVLLVDEDAGMPDSLAPSLRLEEYDVRLASNGQEAVNALRSTGFDLVLLDLEMPVTDGWDALSQIVTMSLSLPVIIITGHADQREMATQKGVTAVLEKPLDLNLLREVMGQVLVKTAEARRRRIEAGTSPPLQEPDRINL
jgi:DNA-binding NtrC family response regulator